MLASAMIVTLQFPVRTRGVDEQLAITIHGRPIRPKP
jgi:hypothetical protein